MHGVTQRSDAVVSCDGDGDGGDGSGGGGGDGFVSCARHWAQVEASPGSTIIRPAPRPLAVAMMAAFLFSLMIGGGALLKYADSWEAKQCVPRRKNWSIALWQGRAS